MKKLSYVLLLIATFYWPNAFAIQETKNALDITTRAFGRSLDFTSDTTTTTRDKFKLVQAAKNDAAAYVASNGEIQGPYLTKALAFIRSEFPEAKEMKDIELAKAILAVK